MNTNKWHCNIPLKTYFLGLINEKGAVGTGTQKISCLC